MPRSSRVVTVSPLSVNNVVLIRTVTHYYTGRIIELTPDEIVLSDAAWIPDTGRFSKALSAGVFSEVEPYVDGVSINRGAVVDVTIWRHTLPNTVK